jgi:hypothetical protein
MKFLDDAIDLHHKLIARLEEADFACRAAERQELLTLNWREVLLHLS